MPTRLAERSSAATAGVSTRIDAEPMIEDSGVRRPCVTEPISASRSVSASARRRASLMAWATPRRSKLAVASARRASMRACMAEGSPSLASPISMASSPYSGFLGDTDRTSQRVPVSASATVRPSAVLRAGEAVDGVADRIGHRWSGLAPIRGAAGWSAAK